MVVYQEPWPHIVIDDYYAPDVFEVLKKEAKTFIRNNVDTSTRKHAFAYPDNQVLRDAIDSRPLDTSYFDILTEHRPYTDINLFWEVNFLIGPLTYPIHDEASRKVLSCVVYVDPSDNAGTRLYDKDKNLVKEIAWKPNRALIFAAQDGVTWHDYTCPKGSHRITINQFLERPRDE